MAAKNQWGLTTNQERFAQQAAQGLTLAAAYRASLVTEIMPVALPPIHVTHTIEA